MEERNKKEKKIIQEPLTNTIHHHLGAPSTRHPYLQHAIHAHVVQYASNSNKDDNNTAAAAAADLVILDRFSKSLRLDMPRARVCVCVRRVYHTSLPAVHLTIPSRASLRRGGCASLELRWRGLERVFEVVSFY
jgi:hypothetical protein